MTRPMTGSLSLAVEFFWTLPGGNQAIETVSFAQIATAATPKGAVLYGLTAGGAVSSRVSVDWSWLALFGGGPAGGRSDRIHVALAAAKHPLVHETVARVTCGRLDWLESCYVGLGRSRREADGADTAYVELAHMRLGISCGRF